MKRGVRRIEARGSEVPVGSWLETIGAADVRYIGGGVGPPDYLVRFGGEEVAVEVTRVLDDKGWPEHQRIGFERALAAVVEMIAKKKGAPRWHTWCEYDPSMRRPPKPSGAWRKVVKESLRTPGQGGAVQLIPYGSRVGRGIVPGYMPAGNAGGFAGVSKDTGIRPAGTAADRIADVVAIKAQKVQKGLRAQAFSRWWLVLDEEIVFFHPILGREWTYVEDCVRSCEGVEQWNKVVLYSRFTGSWRTIHEHGGEPALPVCGPRRGCRRQPRGWLSYGLPG